MWWANIKRSKIFLIILFDILLIGGLSSLIETRATESSLNSLNLPNIKGEFNVDYYFDYGWENSTLDQWNYTDSSEYEEFFFFK